MLGQAKWVPGQVSYAALPPGRTAPFDYGPLIQAGLPLAPYVEHGSWVTGRPAIMRYGRDPYRGILGDTRWTGIPNYLAYDLRPYQGILKPITRKQKDMRWTGMPNYLKYDPSPYRGRLGRVGYDPRTGESWGGCMKGVGMGDLLTDLACERSQFAQDWRNRFGEAMNTTLYVAVGAGAAAGLIGALTKRPLIGLVGGAIVGWMVHQSQVATYADFLPRS